MDRRPNNTAFCGFDVRKLGEEEAEGAGDDAEEGHADGTEQGTNKDTGYIPTSKEFVSCDENNTQCL